MPFFRSQFASKCPPRSNESNAVLPIHPCTAHISSIAVVDQQGRLLQRVREESTTFEALTLDSCDRLNAQVRLTCSLGVCVCMCVHVCSRVCVAWTGAIALLQSHIYPTPQPKPGRRYLKDKKEERGKEKRWLMTPGAATAAQSAAAAVP